MNPPHLLTSVLSRLLRAGIALFLASTAQAKYSVRVPLADGFDQAVGKPNAGGYYVFRGFWPNVHLGEDWNGNGGGDSDLGDPVYAIADGVVVFSDDYRRRWGNVIIVRHAYREKNGNITYVDSLYGHLDRRMAKKYQIVKRGQQIGTIGNCYGVYAAHLHLEIRKNLSIGMNRSAYAKDYSNYYSPRQFIADRRSLPSRGEEVAVPVDTFGYDSGKDEREPGTQPPPGKSKTPIPIRQAPRTNAEEERRKQLEQQLQKLAEENRKKAEEMNEEDMDSFWKKLKDKLKK